MNKPDTHDPARRVQPGQPDRIDPDGPPAADPNELPRDLPLQDFPSALEPGWGPASWFRLGLVLFALLIGGLAILRWAGG